MYSVLLVIIYIAFISIGFYAAYLLVFVAIQIVFTENLNRQYR